MVVAIYVTHARLERGDGRCRVLLVLRRSRYKGGAPSGWRRRCRRFDNASDVVERTSARARVLRAYLLRRHGARLFAGDVPRATWRGTCARLEVTRVGPFARALRCAARCSFPRRRFGDRTAFERETRVLPIANGSTRHTCDHVIFDLLPKPRRTRLIRRARGDVEVSGAAGASQRAAALPP
jgi:hypothetical protein